MKDQIETTTRSPGSVALRLSDVSKTFGSFRALKDVSFDVGAGRIHGLMGGNGSGKSTLIKILAGVHQGDPGGMIGFENTAVPSDQVTPELARRLGLRFVHQNPAVFATMTVAENMAIGAGFPTRAGAIRWQTLRGHTQALLDRFEIDARATDMVGDLRQAEQTMIAIARALQDADENAISALILDEPTASLPDQEVAILLDAVRRFAGMGHTILYVSHRLDEVLDITDDVTVLRDGHHVETRPTEGLSESDLIRLIVGHDLERGKNSASEARAQEGPPILTVRNLAGGPLKDVSFDVAPGETVGIAGLLGSGRSEILHMIFGDMAADAGTIAIAGEAAHFAEPRSAMAAGVALVPEDRAKEGVFQGLSVRENLSGGQVSEFMSFGRVRARSERQAAERAIETYRVKTEGPEALISSLSGGNQQKVVMARWLRRDPRLLLLDEPTQGVDVGAREDLYDSIRESASKGLGVLVASSDFDELTQICDRILILRDGCIAAELTGDRINRHDMTEMVMMSEGKDL